MPKMTDMYCVAHGPALQSACEAHGQSFDEAISYARQRNGIRGEVSVAGLGVDGRWYKPDGSLHRGSEIEGY